jgi:hypothetical protein
MEMDLENNRRFEQRSLRAAWHEGFEFQVDFDWPGKISTQSEKYAAFVLSISISRTVLQSVL